MAIADLISDLEKAEQGDRVFDGPIGLAVGWKRKVEYETKPGQAEAQRRVLWFRPNGQPSRIVQFTETLIGAVDLVETVAPKERWGVSWADGRGTAIIGEGPYSEAATPALALCIAALRVQMAKVGDI